MKKKTKKKAVKTKLKVGKAKKTLKLKAKVKKPKAKALKTAKPKIAKPKMAKKPSKGLSIVELFKMKQQKLNQTSAGDAASNSKGHTKESHPKSELKPKFDLGKRISGFGGSRHS